MLIRCCLLLVAVGYLDGIEANVVRLLANVDKPNRSVEQEGKDVPTARQSMSTRSYFTPVRPPDYVVHQAPAPIVDIEEGNYFEGDIILRPEQQLNPVSSFLSTCTKFCSI
jgi:hypothetical protein